jgi:hypothetical protein
VINKHLVALSLTMLKYELNWMLHYPPTLHVFQLRCRLFTEPIIVTVDYEWKLGAYKICKVFGHSCKTSVKAPTLSEKDMLKIKKKNRGMLYKFVAHQL